MTGKFGRIEFGILLEGTDKSGPNVGATQGPTSINIVNNEKRIFFFCGESKVRRARRTIN